MIVNKVLKLKKEAKLINKITFPAGQEIEIVTDVVYVNGHPLMLPLQASTLKWIVENPTLFDDKTLNWKKG